MIEKWRKKYTKSCLYCGKSFHPFRPSHAFCSFDCGLAGRRGKTARNSIDVPCSNCGKIIQRKQYSVSKFTRFYCSWACKNAFHRHQYIGKLNPNYKNAGNHICIGCGKVFKSYRKDQRYCGRKCGNTHSRSHALACVKMGFATEKRCCDELKKKGYHCTLSTDSRGAFDVIAINKQEILLIQVKFTTSKYRIFQKKQIELFRLAPCPKLDGIQKQMWTYLDGIGWKIKTL